MTSVGVGLVRLEDPTIPQTEHGDHCISVSHKQLPDGMSFPSHHDGVRVITRKVSCNPRPL